MVEALIFIGIAWLVLRTRTWNRGPYITDHIDFSVLGASVFDDGPLRIQAEPDNEDPNSNPDYIWYERS